LHFCWIVANIKCWLKLLLITTLCGFSHLLFPNNYCIQDDASKFDFNNCFRRKFSFSFTPFVLKGDSVYFKRDLSCNDLLFNCVWIIRINLITLFVCFCRSTGPEKTNQPILNEPIHSFFQSLIFEKIVVCDSKNRFSFHLQDESPWTRLL